jgi:hypothetical protein
MDFATGVFRYAWEMCALQSGEHFYSIYKCMSCQTLSTNAEDPLPR